MKKGKSHVDLLLLVVAVLGEAAIANQPEQNRALPRARWQRDETITPKEGAFDPLLLR